MENDKENIHAVSQVIAKDFEVTESNSLIPAVDIETLGEFKNYLTEKIADLLDNKYETLINILYRIDVSEEKLSDLFSGTNRDYLPRALAELIIDRQMQKVRLREKYKKGEI